MPVECNAIRGIITCRSICMALSKTSKLLFNLRNSFIFTTEKLKLFPEGLTACEGVNAHEVTSYFLHTTRYLLKKEVSMAQKDDSESQSFRR